MGQKAGVNASDRFAASAQSFQARLRGGNIADWPVSFSMKALFEKG